MQPDDAYWRRPAVSDAEARPSPAPHRPGPPAPGYSGPPPSLPPPRHWRVPHYVQLPPPRPLPEQDHGRLDAEETRARTLTYGLGMISLAVLVVVTAILCGRYLF